MAYFRVRAISVSGHVLWFVRFEATRPTTARPTNATDSATAAAATTTERARSSNVTEVCAPFCVPPNTLREPPPLCRLVLVLVLVLVVAVVVVVVARERALALTCRRPGQRTANRSGSPHNWRDDERTIRWRWRCGGSPEATTMIVNRRPSSRRVTQKRSCPIAS